MISCPLLGLLVLPSGACCMGDENAVPIVMGVMHKEYAFACGFERERRIEPVGQGLIVMTRTRMVGDAQVVTRLLPQMVASADDVPVLLRWRMYQGAYWSIGFWPIPSGTGRKSGGMSRLPAELLNPLDPEFGVRDGKPHLGSLDLQCIAGLEPLARAYGDASVARECARRNVISGLFDDRLEINLEYAAGVKPSPLQVLVRQIKASVREQLSPLLDICDVVEFSYKTMPYTHYDFLPNGKDGCTLFIRNGRSMSRWQYQKEIPKDHGNCMEDWSLKESWQVDWSEPFYVHRQESTYFFVTESGKVYSAKPAARGGDGTMKRLQINRPVVALVWDWTGDRAFAFGEDFFFELEQGSQVSQCENVMGKGRGMDQVLSTIVNCARVLKKAKAKR